MIQVGKTNRTKVLRMTEFGAFVDGGDLGDILIPKRYVSSEVKIGDTVTVFVYFDSDDKLIATTDKPYAEVGQFANLKCVNTNSVGAFLNWGLPKDLLVPFSEQRNRLEEDRFYVVYLYLDKASGRIVGTRKYNKFLDKMPARYKKNEQVHITIIEQTELGYKCAINDRHTGLLFKTECFGKLFVGKSLKAFIKNIREDGKIDLSLQALGRGKVDDLAERIIVALEKKGGFIPVSDKSTPEQIFSVFKTSKATYKKTIGALYKQKVIRIEADGIYLVKK